MYTLKIYISPYAQLIASSRCGKPPNKSQHGVEWSLANHLQLQKGLHNAPKASDFTTTAMYWEDGIVPMITNVYTPVVGGGGQEMCCRCLESARIRTIAGQFATGRSVHDTWHGCPIVWGQPGCEWTCINMVMPGKRITETNKQPRHVTKVWKVMMFT